MDDEDPGGSDATVAEPLTQAETRADGEPRAYSPRLVIRVLGGPEQWGDVTRPTSSPADRLPPFDVSFFDAAPAEPSQLTRSQSISVWTGREDTQSFGDLVGEPGRDGDELIPSPTPNLGVAPVVAPLAAIDAVSTGSHPGGRNGSGSPANDNPQQPSPTPRQQSTDNRRRRRMLAIGPVAMLVAVVTWIMLLAAPPRPKVGSTPSTSRRQPASSTPLPTTKHTTSTKPTAPLTTQTAPITTASTPAPPGAVMPSPNAAAPVATQGPSAGLPLGGGGAAVGHTGGGSGGGSSGGSGGSGGGSPQPTGSSGAAGQSTSVAPSTLGGGGATNRSTPASPPTTRGPATTSPSPATTLPTAPASSCDNPILCP